MFNFLLGFQTVILIILLFWIYLFLLTLVFVLQWLSLYWKFWSCCCFSFHWLSIKFTTDAPFHRLADDYSHAGWNGLRDHLRDVSWEDIFKLGASAAASEICEWVQVGTDTYIPHRKYQVKPHSSPRFSAVCVAVIAHRNTFFVCTKRRNLLVLKYSSNRLVIVAKGFLKLPNLHMVIKQESINSVFCIW